MVTCAGNQRYNGEECYMTITGEARGVQPQRMTGAQAVITSLEAAGVEFVFGYPGGYAIQLYDALFESRRIRHVLARHEQGAVHEADGYARATGEVGVAMVTSGPGATNTVTGIATAYMDSVPLVVITGQAPRGVIGTDSFQESDTFGITMPVVKHSYLLKDVNDVARTVREAFHIASTGRPGPVLIDVPSDLAAESVVFDYPEKVNIASYRPTYKGNAKQVKAAAKLIGESTRPVLLIGGGVIASGASGQVTRLMRDYSIPVATTLMAKGAVPSGEPLNMGAVGMHGSRYANEALNRSDLIVVVGARFSNRVTGDPDEFAPGARIVHIDIDPAEIDKVRKADVPIVGDAALVLDALLAELEARDERPDTAEWVSTIADWRERYPILSRAAMEDDTQIIPERALMALSEMLSGRDSIVVTEVGQNQMWAAQFVDREKPRTFLSSGGLGTMGFGLPAAIGAALGRPEAMVVCIAGDGSLQMNVQEMATAVAEGAVVKVVLLNNQALGMVRQWQKLFYGGRYSATELPDLPDFVALARAYSWEADRVSDPAQVRGALERMLASDRCYLLDVRIDREQNVFPMVAPGKGLAETFTSVEGVG